MSRSTPSFSVRRGPLDDPGLAASWGELQALGEDDPAFALDWAGAVARLHELRPHVYLVEHKTTPVAGAVVFERRRGLFNAVVSPTFVSYTAWKAPGDAAAIHQRASPEEMLLEHLARDFDRVRLHLPPAVFDARPFQWRGWQVSPLYTYTIPLGTVDDPLARWSDSARRRFYAASEAYQFAESQDAAVLLGLSRTSYDRQERAYPAVPARLQACIESLLASGRARIFTTTAREADTPAAAVGLLVGRDRAYYWIAGSLPGDAMTVLLGHLLPHLRDAGIRVFDFVGANTPSIAEFKRRLGGVLTPYLAAERINHPVLRTLARVWPR